MANDSSLTPVSTIPLTTDSRITPADSECQPQIFSDLSIGHESELRQQIEELSEQLTQLNTKVR